jgi:predicted Rossmann-fold nucleotide-binding protein
MKRMLPIIGVFGSGKPVTELDPSTARDAAAVGRLVATLGAHLLTGGGRGVMQAAATAFVETPGRTGFSIGVIPTEGTRFDEPKAGYPNPAVEIPIFVPLQSLQKDWLHRPSRNHVNVLSAHAVVVLPGDTGTANEIEMTSHYRGESLQPIERRRAVLFGGPNAFSPAQRELFCRVDTIGAVEEQLRRVLSAGGFALAA